MSQTISSTTILAVASSTTVCNNVPSSIHDKILKTAVPYRQAVMTPGSEATHPLLAAVDGTAFYRYDCEVACRKILQFKEICD